ncbi:TerB family tellurite resistance protein [Candidatus Uabimicrobium amorphum]|uniref:Co-chaperone DjlA N-terminal domain-containing protein n=1 Tax=Uabimicrobium amorphum TaxID=2596890 RepID=A0A5S9IKE0_UABAM|nr:TerB family tellurite resistance protein [Candidatus Uabimicrobium amorphum]BBM83483.1 hypothetical protein UABAM_01835 [Candidatus Uabimicrobium amorphum]
MIRTRGVERTIKRGRFLCPTCKEKCKYKLVKVERYVSVHVIPVIPKGTAGNYVECQSCKGTFKKSVLALAKRQEKKVSEEVEEQVFEAQYKQAIKNVMFLIMTADRVIEESEVQHIMLVYKQLTGEDLQAQNIKRSGIEMAMQQKKLRDYLSDIYPSLNLQGKMKVLQSAMEVASADGRFQLEEQQMIHDLVKVLQIPVKNANCTIQQYFDVDVVNIAFACPHCQRPTRIKHSLKPIGKKKKCKGCQQTYQLSRDVVKPTSLICGVGQFVTKPCDVCENQIHIKPGIAIDKQRCTYCCNEQTRPIPET